MAPGNPSDVMSVIVSHIRRRRAYLVFSGLLLSLTIIVFSLRADLTSVGQLTANPFKSFEGGGQGSQGGRIKTKPDQFQEMQKPLAPMQYGTAARPAFTDLQGAIADLPSEYLPSHGAPTAVAADAAADVDPQSPAGRRLVIVGDVHGQLSALQALLKKTGFEKVKGDHLVFAGDMVNKGPDSAGVVKLAMDLDASAVRGNHEDRVILTWTAMKDRSARSSARGADDNATGDTDGGDSAAVAKAHAHARRDDDPATLDTLEQEPFAHSDQGERDTVASLSSRQLQWLSSLPVILRLGRIPGAESPPWNSGNVVVVHGGLTPGVPLENQDPWMVMNMRGLVYPAEELRRKTVLTVLEEAERDRTQKDDVKIADADVDAHIDRIREARRREGQLEDPDRIVAVPVEKGGTEPWSNAFSRYQAGLTNANNRTTVVYGHDAKAGLKVADGDGAKGRRYAFGLDSGCIYGRQLSALVIESGPKGVKHSIVQVDCKKAKGASLD